MTIFTTTDKALLLRAARHLDTRSSNLELANTPWGATPEGKVAKREFDRLKRDARDLRSLAKRLKEDPLPGALRKCMAALGPIAEDEANEKRSGIASEALEAGNKALAT